MTPRMAVTLARAEPGDVDALLPLLEEMDRFYGAEEFEPLEVRARQVRQALFSDPPAAYVLLAWEEGLPIGFASYSFLWPAAGVTRSLYLKELWVTQDRWRGGVGTALMQRLFEVAAEHGCSRVEWTTDVGNAGAQEFYDALGVSPLETKLFYRADGPMIAEGLR